MRIPTFLLHPAFGVSLVIHGGLAAVAALSGGSGGAQHSVESVSAAIEFDPADAETRDAEDAASSTEPEAPTPLVELSEVLVPGTVVEGESTPIEPSPLSDVALYAAPVAPPSEGVTNTTISVRLRPLPSAPPAAVARPAPPATVASAPSERGRIVTPPGRLATNRAPVYPYEARAQGIEGVALLRVGVRADGSVASVHLKASSGHALLDLAAEDAVRDWGFTPPRLDGFAVPMTVDVPVAFRLY